MYFSLPLQTLLAVTSTEPTGKQLHTPHMEVAEALTEGSRQGLSRGKY
jgi:hypothetical protein